MSFYNAFLLRSPNTANALSGGIIGVVGDTIAQGIEASKEPKDFNFRRSCYVFGFGALTGPPAIQWFRFLERSLGSEVSVKNITRKVVLNQLVFSPTLTSFFYIYINCCNHYHEGLKSVKEHSVSALKRDFFPSMVASSCYWPFVQAANFAIGMKNFDQFGIVSLLPFGIVILVIVDIKSRISQFR